MKTHPFVAGGTLTVADFALFPYIHLSPQGGYDLSAYPAIEAWMKRFEALPAFEPLVPES